MHDVRRRLRRPASAGSPERNTLFSIYTKLMCGTLRRTRNGRKFAFRSPAECANKIGMDSETWKGKLAAFEQHPLARCFPPMPPSDFAELRADIAKHGLRQPIILYQGKVLDGWHRCRSCSETGTEIRTEEFKGDERAARGIRVVGQPQPPASHHQ